jgi:hypothetical protein
MVTVDTTASNTLSSYSSYSTGQSYSNYDYIQNVCYPTNSSDFYDVSAPAISFWWFRMTASIKAISLPMKMRRQRAHKNSRNASAAGCFGIISAGETILPFYGNPERR